MEVGLNSNFSTGAIEHQLAANVTRYNEEYNLNAKYFDATYTYDTNIYNPVWETPSLNFDAPRRHRRLTQV